MTVVVIIIMNGIPQLIGNDRQLSTMVGITSLVVNQCTFILRNSVVILLNIALSFHVDRELVEFVPIDEQEYDEVIEEYEEEIFVQEGAQEPVSADLTDPSSAQGKPRCITPILMITEYIYVMCI